MNCFPDFLVGGVVRGEFILKKPSDGVTPVNANSTPSVVVAKNGTDNVESVTVSAISGVTGGYRMAHTPADAAEGDLYTYRITSPITDASFNGGSAFNHIEIFAARCKAVERGTNSAALASGVNVTQLAGQTVTAAAGVTFPSSVASPTNITEGTITTVTNLTNAPTSGDLTATMKASVTAAVPTATQVRQEMDTNSTKFVSLESKVDTIDTVVDGIALKTTNLPSDPADQSIIIAAAEAILTAVSDVQSRIPAALVSGKMSCHVVTIADDAVNVAATDALLVSWIQENLATTAEVAAIPLAALLLDWTTVEDTVPSRSMLNALRHIRNKWAITDTTTKTVMCEDDVTPAYTTTITVDSNGNITADTPA